MGGVIWLVTFQPYMVTLASLVSLSLSLSLPSSTNSLNFKHYRFFPKTSPIVASEPSFSYLLSKETKKTLSGLRRSLLTSKAWLNHLKT